MPGAVWSPSPNYSRGGVTRPPHGAVLHTADGTYEGTIGWQHNPASQVSSFFVTAKDGRIAQCVDTDNKAWTQGAGNASWIGIENEGHGEQGDPLTDPQLDANARIYAWLVTQYPSIPLLSTDDPNGTGLGWHGMGAAVGWGHPGCPGELIKAQRPEILRRASLLLHHAPTPTEDEVISYPSPNKQPNVFSGVEINVATNVANVVGGAHCEPDLHSTLATNPNPIRGAYPGPAPHTFTIYKSDSDEYHFTLS